MTDTQTPPAPQPGDVMMQMIFSFWTTRALYAAAKLGIADLGTVVDDTRDTAFVIFAVIVGMAVGTGLLLVAAVGVPLVGLAALALNILTSDPVPGLRTFTLTVRLTLGRDPALLAPVIAAHARLLRTTSAKTARQGSALDLIQLIQTTDDQLPALVLALNAVEGVQDVEINPQADE